MMGPLQAVGSVFSKYAMFRGRAPRSEYWWFYLFEILAFVALVSVDIWFLFQTPEILENPVLFDPFSLFTLYYMILSFIPRLAVTVRRLHDAGMSGFMVLTMFIPVVGWLVLMVLMMMPSDANDNIHGPPWRPMGRHADTDGWHQVA